MAARKLLPSGRWRIGVGLGYSEVNSAGYPRDYGHDAAHAAQAQKKPARVLGFNCPEAKLLERLLTDLALGKQVDEGQLAAAASAAAQVSAGHRPARAFQKRYL